MATRRTLNLNPGNLVSEDRGIGAQDGTPAAWCYKDGRGLDVYVDNGGRLTRVRIPRRVLRAALGA